MIDRIVIKNYDVSLNLNKLGKSFNRSTKKDGSQNYKFKIYRRTLQILDPGDDDEDANDYPYSYGEYDSYLILMANSISGFTISGSLRKWWFSAKSANADLNFFDFCKAIKLLAKKIGVKEDVLWKSNVSNVEIGGNIELSANYKTIIGSIESFPNRNRFGDRRHTVYFHQKTNAEEIIFYDKITQLYRRQKNIKNKTKVKLLKHVFILRYEIKINTPSKTQFALYMGPLYKIRDNWGVIIDRWQETFNKVELLVNAPPKLPQGSPYLTRTQLKNYFINLGVYNYGGLDAVNKLIMETVKPKKTDDEKKEFLSIVLDNVEQEFLDYMEIFVESVYCKANKMKKGFYEVNNIL